MMYKWFRMISSHMSDHTTSSQSATFFPNPRNKFTLLHIFWYSSYAEVLERSNIFFVTFLSVKINNITILLQQLKRAVFVSEGHHVVQEHHFAIVRALQ